MRDDVRPTQHSRTLSLTTGSAGIAAVILLFGAQGLMQFGGVEPPFDAPTVEIQRFFESRNSGFFAVGSYLSVLGLVVLLWFFAGVSALLKDADQEGPWRANIALSSGVVFVATVIPSSWELAAFRIGDGLDPQLARLAFDMGNLWFASSWVALGGFSLVGGWVMLSARLVPPWLGWWPIVAGAGLVAARASWTSPVWFFPFALFWMWVIMLSLRMIRRQSGSSDTQ